MSQYCPRGKLPKQYILKIFHQKYFLSLIHTVAMMHSYSQRADIAKLYKNMHSDKQLLLFFYDLHL